MFFSTPVVTVWLLFGDRFALQLILSVWKYIVGLPFYLATGDMSHEVGGHLVVLRRIRNTPVKGRLGFHTSECDISNLPGLLHYFLFLWK